MSTKKATETEPVDDAVAEVLGGPVNVEFRGIEFEIPRAVFASPQLGLALAAGKFNDITYAMLAAVGTDATARFLSVCTPEDTMASVALEFINAVSAVAGQGNS